MHMLHPVHGPGADRDQEEHEVATALVAEFSRRRWAWLDPFHSMHGALAATVTRLCHDHGPCQGRLIRLLDIIL